MYKFTDVLLICSDDEFHTTRRNCESTAAIIDLSLLRITCSQINGTHFDCSPATRDKPHQTTQFL